MKVFTKASVAGLAAVLAFGIAPAAADQARRARPANDDLAAAKVILETPFNHTANLRSAGIEIAEPQSTCGIIKSSVWYQITPAEDVQLEAEISSAFNSILAVYSDASPEGLAQVSCGGPSTSPEVSFSATGGKTYLLQLGSTSKKAGKADLHLATTSWREKTLTTISQPVEVKDTGSPMVSVHGRPRAGDRSTYDITVTAAGQPSIKRGILTFGLVQEEINVELIRIPRQHVQADITIGYRYDSSQYACITDDGNGGPCTVKSPIKDVRWLTSGEGSKAELFVRVKLSKDEKPLAERTVTVPYAGQIPGLQ